ncbi:MAG: FKBP-type peptidyl-prolyl cis-trans isomerase [Cyclobacteriaceae bacterium]|nr:FKBP-type peptidyl-prolyl cis-trans isomerase [Cyclobacteriaceae bacterium]
MYSSIKLVSFALVLGFLFSACGEGKFKEAKEGYKISYIQKGSGESLDEGDLLMINMSYKDSKDSLIFSSVDSGDPVVIPYNKEAWDEAGQLYAAFSVLKKGDSVVLKILASDLFNKAFRMDTPEEYPLDSYFTFEVGVIDIMDQEGYASFEERKNEAQFEIDQKKIDDYLSQNSIDAEKTSSGLYYLIDSEGSGPNPSMGDEVSVHYRGTLLDGTVFDSSFDRQDEPFTFPIGQGMVIPGWDEGIALLKKGGKGKLFIPSKLAYGSRNMGTIQPNSVLIFDVELIDIARN